MGTPGVECILDSVVLPRVVRESKDNSLDVRKGFREERNKNSSYRRYISEEEKREGGRVSTKSRGKIHKTPGMESAKGVVVNDVIRPISNLTTVFLLRFTVPNLFKPQIKTVYL